MGMRDGGFSELSCTVCACAYACAFGGCVFCSGRLQMTLARGEGIKEGAGRGGGLQRPLLLPRLLEYSLLAFGSEIDEDKIQ